MSTTTSATSLPQQGQVLHGVPAVGGVQYAPVVRPGARPSLDETPVADIAESERPAEVERLKAASAAVADRLRARAAHATGVASEVLATTAQLAQDRAWLRDAEKRIVAGAPATRAVAGAVGKIADALAKAGDLMAERVTDLRDIRDRVIAELSGLPEPGVPVPDRPSILCAEDLAPVDTAGLDASLVVGLATSLGGPTSHTAIIARQLGIPCVVAVDGLDDVPAGTMIMVDGSVGTVTVTPDEAVAARAVEGSRRDAEAARQWTGPGVTADGHPVAILANVQDGA
ncbi:MAG: phosphoenolpyruvate--protein phosphotransferase, partial [Mycolicibacterium sp.]|nr:phosphoenolpyruvate--protein phosphotransferase [Mycolicibacterium sp.]